MPADRRGPRRSAFAHFNEVEWIAGIRDRVRDALLPRHAAENARRSVLYQPMFTERRTKHNESLLALEPEEPEEAEEQQELNDEQMCEHMQRTREAMQELLALGGVMHSEDDAPVRLDDFGERVWRVESDADMPSVTDTPSSLFAAFRDGDKVDIDALLRSRMEVAEPSSLAKKLLIEEVGSSGEDDEEDEDKSEEEDEDEDESEEEDEDEESVEEDEDESEEEQDESVGEGEEEDQVESEEDQDKHKDVQVEMRKVQVEDHADDQEETLKDPDENCEHQDKGHESTQDCTNDHIHNANHTDFDPSLSASTQLAHIEPLTSDPTQIHETRDALHTAETEALYDVSHTSHSPPDKPYYPIVVLSDSDHFSAEEDERRTGEAMPSDTKHVDTNKQELEAEVETEMPELHHPSQSKFEAKASDTAQDGVYAEDRTPAPLMPSRLGDSVQETERASTITHAWPSSLHPPSTTQLEEVEFLPGVGDFLQHTTHHDDDLYAVIDFSMGGMDSNCDEHNTTPTMITGAIKVPAVLEQDSPNQTPAPATPTRDPFASMEAEHTTPTTRLHCTLQRLTLTRMAGAPTFLVRSCTLDPIVLHEEGAECQDVFTDALEMQRLDVNMLPAPAYHSLHRIVGSSMIDEVYVVPTYGPWTKEDASSADEVEDTLNTAASTQDMPPPRALRTYSRRDRRQHEPKVPSIPSPRRTRKRKSEPHADSPAHMRLRSAKERRPPRRFSP
ncbi:hypothetical protein MVES1_000441 [Malassezia vespertilionis]|uniref:Uncharacterized protein n=1 Tax=Malassezia vespertilionis TaxID=2020962 RepID=A0A2N1JHF1_9BASI|nr:uncharacterized protein MVES1_000441 [Malassezia vespertilionis]PKI85958.1 hypothetical protein MVES_000408 [Malassezia vespertilionis]WFD05115.1 hypothetical protein MVES1_000441 [Malassezia vespertilionis]